MRIAIIGAGRVGSTLGQRWADAGHQITFGVRQPDSDRVGAAVAACGPSSRATTVQEAPADADVVVLTVPWSAVGDAVSALGDLENRVLIDCTNPIGEGPAGVSGESGAETVAVLARNARVIKAFNTTGSGNMASPEYPGGGITMLLCGDDQEAKSVVTQLAVDIGFTPEDAGGLSAARHLEALALLWIHLVYSAGYGPDIAFRLERR